MKKLFLIQFIFLMVLPSYALCPIEGGESVCSLPNFRERVSPIYQDNGGIHNFGSNPDVQLQPMKRDSMLKDMRNPNNELNYNSSCQFGVCLPNSNNTLMMQQRDNY